MKNHFAIFALTIGILLIFTSMLSGEDFKQPVLFSHKNHVEKNEIPCEFCHTYARRSLSSGAPSMESCFGCHQVVKGSDEEQKAEIVKLLEYWDAKQPIPWKKIHDVPDFVHFSHKRHINVGLDCTDCHGDIMQQELISFNSMINDLSMGWCMECHNTVHPTAKGKIVAPARKTRGNVIVEDAKLKKADGTMVGSTDCYACHK